MTTRTLIVLVTAICGCILLVGFIMPRPAFSEEPVGYADVFKAGSLQQTSAQPNPAPSRPLGLRLRDV